MDLKDEGSGSYSKQDDVVLSGNGLTLTYQFDEGPSGSVWKSYDIALAAGVGWINRATGADATASELQSVLGDLSELKIRAEHLSGDDTFSLDTVYIAATDAPAWRVSDAPVNDVITVKEDTDATVTLGGSDADQDALTAKITRLTSLFQFSSGVRGAAINSGSPLVSDPHVKRRHTLQRNLPNIYPEPPNTTKPHRDYQEKHTPQNDRH